jgi:hypothetical protein
MDPLFGHEKLDVYCVELGFVAWIAAFLTLLRNRLADIDAS